MFTVMHFCILYGAYLGAVNNLQKSPVDIGRLSCFLLGVFFIVTGNFMPKSKNNPVAGVRTTWSMYNDNTWRKSNRFGAIVLVMVGILTIITTVFAGGKLSTILMLIYILLSTIAIIIYSKIVYDQEQNK